MKMPRFLSGLRLAYKHKYYDELPGVWVLYLNGDNKLEAELNQHMHTRGTCDSVRK